MANDVEILKEVWEGNVAVRFTLASHEVTRSGTPNSLYLMLQRSSYLPLVNEKVKKHFCSFIDEDLNDEIWYDYNGEPIKWHYPVGVIFDIFCGATAQVPIDVTVHFKDFPIDNLIHFHSPEAVEAHFMSMLKEADQLKHRGQVMNNMNKTQHKQLWHSLRNNNYDQFWSVNRKLMEGYEGTNGFKYIPMRVYFQDNVFQKLFPPFNEHDSSESAISNCVLEILSCCSYDLEVKDLSIILQGIVVQPSTSLQWLSEHLSYADNFLHIVLIRNIEDG